MAEFSLRLEPLKDAYFECVCEQAVRLVRMLDVVVAFTIDGVALTAYPNSTIGELIAQYRREVKDED